MKRRHASGRSSRRRKTRRPRRTSGRHARRATRVARGKTVGKYRIVGPLGHGGMSTGYKAGDETLDREVAIKVLHFDLVDPRAIRRFSAEATTLAKLNHPANATIFELFESKRVRLLVMELVLGES